MLAHPSLRHGSEQAPVSDVIATASLRSVRPRARAHPDEPAIPGKPADIFQMPSQQPGGNTLDANSFSRSSCFPTVFSVNQVTPATKPDRRRDTRDPARRPAPVALRRRLFNNPACSGRQEKCHINVAETTMYQHPPPITFRPLRNNTVSRPSRGALIRCSPMCRGDNTLPVAVPLPRAFAPDNTGYAPPQSPLLAADTCALAGSEGGARAFRRRAIVI